MRNRGSEKRRIHISRQTSNNMNTEVEMRTNKVPNQVHRETECEQPERSTATPPETLSKGSRKASQARTSKVNNERRSWAEEKHLFSLDVLCAILPPLLLCKYPTPSNAETSQVYYASLPFPWGYWHTGAPKTRRAAPFQRRDHPLVEKTVDKTVDL